MTDAPPDRSDPSSSATDTTSALAVFLVFLRLGLTSFGGPVAHLGYFRAELVQRRRWLSDAAYADLVALCQFLPGPASSQVGLGLGLHRAGPSGALAAWAGFTLPSALALALAALGVAALDPGAASGWLQGLKLVAAAVVLVWPLSGWPLAVGQLAPIAIGAVVGWMLFRGEATATAADHLRVGLSRRAGALCLATLALLLMGLPLLAGLTAEPAVRLADGMVRAGSLVFGGGHVVLPLLQAEVVPSGLVERESFLAGYGLAQAVPGPLFTLAAYLGAAAGSSVLDGLALALVATVAIFVPAALLLFGALPFWSALRSAPAARAALTGINAAVVGLLLAAFYDPVLTSAVAGPQHVAFGLTAFLALATWGVPPWLVVAAGAALGGLLL